MLFDLRGAGRRRTVQGIYLTLAVLMGGGLVLFGVGGSVSGGLVDALKKNGGGSTGNTFKKRVQTLERRTAAHPRDAHAWAELARARFQDASTGKGYDQATGGFTAAGKGTLRQAAAAWERHVALAKDKPDDTVATLMVQVYGALGDYAKATGAMEIIVGARPKSPALYAQLAQLAYAAGQQRKGDLAAGKAVELAPKDQKQQLKSQLQQAQTQALQAQAQAQTGATTTP